MKRLLLALGGLCLVGLSGCGSVAAPKASSPTTSPLPPASAAPTSTSAPVTPTTAPNPLVIPTHITKAYVDAVFVRLDQVYGDAVRSVVAAKKVTFSAQLDLLSIYTRRLERAEVVSFATQLSDGLSNIRRPPGNMVTTVSRVISATPKCIFVNVHENLRKVVVHPQTIAGTEWIGLRPRLVRRSARGRNPTPWTEFYEIVAPSDDKLPNQCG